jgi:hypothetical protein
MTMILCKNAIMLSNYQTFNYVCHCQAGRIAQAMPNELVCVRPLAKTLSITRLLI